MWSSCLFCNFSSFVELSSIFKQSLKNPVTSSSKLPHSSWVFPPFPVHLSLLFSSAFRSILVFGALFSVSRFLSGFNSSHVSPFPCLPKGVRLSFFRLVDQWCSGARTPFLNFSKQGLQVLHFLHATVSNKRHSCRRFPVSFQDYNPCGDFHQVILL